MIASVAASTWDRSGRWSGPNGVGTATMYVRAVGVSFWALSSPCVTAPATCVARSGSRKGTSPRLTASTWTGLTSTPITCTPFVARMAAVGSPMYPRPITATVLISCIQPLPSAEDVPLLRPKNSRRELASSSEDVTFQVWAIPLSLLIWTKLNLSAA
jgi:hypothetical protein